MFARSDARRFGQSGSAKDQFDRVRLAFGVPSWPGDIDIAAERVRSDMQII